MTAVKDALGIVHRVWANPQLFSTRAGGLAGRTACNLLFYDTARGPSSCSFPNAIPLGEDAGQVTCMACVAAGPS